jgi:hypothetical protein
MPQWRDPGFESRGSHFGLCIFWLVPSQFRVGFLRWLRSHHGHALLPNVRQGQIFNLLRYDTHCLSPSRVEIVIEDDVQSHGTHCFNNLDSQYETAFAGFAARRAVR